LGRGGKIKGQAASGLTVICRGSGPQVGRSGECLGMVKWGVGECKNREITFISYTYIYLFIWGRLGRVYNAHKKNTVNGGFVALWAAPSLVSLLSLK
jgi:hypothetical protein